MSYTEKLENVTVLGAAGKMGSGILLLTALEMADLSKKPKSKSAAWLLCRQSRFDRNQRNYQ